MSAAHLDELLERLNAGDEAVAEQVFRTYEPYLRVVVRRQIRSQLRAKFDSMDIVQSVWADILAGVRSAGWRFADRAQLQAFLVRLARNRFLDRCRKHKNDLAREEPLAFASPAGSVASSAPRPSEVAQQNELWERMLALCPPAHHELLRLKRAGLTFPEIASRTGLHPSSVRRILYDLAARFATKERGRPAAETVR